MPTFSMRVSGYCLKRAAGEHEHRLGQLGERGVIEVTLGDDEPFLIGAQLRGRAERARRGYRGCSGAAGGIRWPGRGGGLGEGDVWDQANQQRGQQKGGGILRVFHAGKLLCDAPWTTGNCVSTGIHLSQV